MTYVYQSLNKDEKINIFQKCQEFLVANYPDSEFIVRRSFLSSGRNKTLETLVKIYKDFNGNVYVDDNCLVFYKIFDVSGIDEIYKKYDNESDANGNTIFVIFATFNVQKSNIYEIIKKELGGEINNISFSRNGKFKIYNLTKFSDRFRISSGRDAL